jgi:hypothetical protein
VENKISQNKSLHSFVFFIIKNNRQRLVNNIVKMAKGDPKKPKGKMSAYAFLVQTCWEEHKKKNPEVPVNVAEFSKEGSERWKTMSGKEKSKFSEMAKADEVRCDREMKDYGPAKGGQKKKDPNAPKRPPSGFFPRLNPHTLACLLETWRKSWVRSGVS